MYASVDFRSKREFKLAVERGEEIVVYSPVMQMPAVNGSEVVTGPWSPPLWRGREKGWQARVEVKDMRVVAVH